MKNSGSLKFLFLLLLYLSPLKAQEQPIEIGKVYTLHSEKLNESREFRVLLPRSYEAGKGAYPVIYVLDGESYYLSAYSSVRALASQGNMPESIVVAVSNPDRTSDMTPPDMKISHVSVARADRFLDFLNSELIPHIDQRYRTRPLRVLIGHSHGAIFNLYALTARPDAFRWHIALDAPMHLNNHYLERLTQDFLEAHPDHKGRLAVAWSRYSWNEKSWQWIQGRAASGFKAWELDLPGETHSSMYHLGMYQGLKKLFADHEYRHTEILSLHELDKRYKAMNEQYGYDIPIPIWALRYGALEHLVAANAQAARPFVERMIKDYGSPMIFDDNAREWLNQLEKSPPAESRADYMNRPDATLAEGKEFLGKWEGNGYEFHLKQVDGKLAGSVAQYFPDGQRMETSFDKLVFHKDGSLELSHRNGMPPLSGLIYYRLSPPENGSLSIENGFRVYWPRMASMNAPKNFKAFMKR